MTMVPGLVPGTLVPLPRPKVVSTGDTAPEGEESGDAAPVADRVMTGAVRKATKLRFGGGGAGPDEAAPPGDDQDEDGDGAPGERQ